MKRRGYFIPHLHVFLKFTVGISAVAAIFFVSLRMFRSVFEAVAFTMLSALAVAMVFWMVKLDPADLPNEDEDDEDE